MKGKHYCDRCGKVEILEPVYCCRGTIESGCGCMGYPIDPPWCDPCYDFIMSDKNVKTENNNGIECS